MDFAEHREEALEAAVLEWRGITGLPLSAASLSNLRFDESWRRAERALAAFLARLRTPEAAAAYQGSCDDDGCPVCAHDYEQVLAALAGDDV